MTVTADTFTNYATSTVAGGVGGVGSPLNNTDTSLYLASGDGAKFPSVAPFMVQIGSAAPYELAKCTARSGDVLTLARGQEGTTAYTWADTTPVEQVATAANLTNIWSALNRGRVFYAQDYGQVADGVTDDTTAIQAAITACQNAGAGAVVLAPARSIINATLTISADNVALLGMSWASTLQAGASFPTTGAPLVNVQAPASGFRYGITVAEMTLDGNNVAGVGGLQLTSTYHAHVQHVRVYQCPGTGIFFTGSSSQRGAYTQCVNCTVTNGGAGIAYQTNYAENNTIIGGLVAWYNTSGGVGFKAQDGVNQIIGVVFDECDTAIWLYFANGTQVIGCQMTRGLTQFLYLQGATNSIIEGCYFDQFVGTASGQHIINCGSTCANNKVSDCITNASTGWPGFLNDNSNSGALNVYTNNQTQGLQVLLNASQSLMRHNDGYNPRGFLSAPAIPASGTAQTNSNGVDVDVYVAGGTVTAIAIDGTATGMTSGAIRVPANHTITLTYSAAPTWVWYGE